MADTIQMLEEIFHEAVVGDFDWSEWDRRLRLVVIATAMTSSYSKRFAGVFNVDLISPISVAWHAFDVDRPSLPNGEHYQWTVIESSVIKRKSQIIVKLHHSVGAEPELIVKCKSVLVEELNPKLIDDVFPGWTDFSPPFIRPSLEKLLKSQNRR